MNTTGILIVSNDTGITENLQNRLNRLGYRIVGVTRGDEEIPSLIEAFSPDLILTDIRLTRTRDDHKTWALIHSTYNIPVIYITGNIDQEALQRAKMAAPSGIIFIPYDDWQLLVTIETTINRHRWESQLRESRKWFNATLTSIREGIIATDEQGTIQFVNPAALEMIRRSQADALGRSIWEVITLSSDNSPENPETTRLQSITGLNISKDFEGLLIARTSRIIPIEASANLITDDTGRTLGTVLVFRNVAKHKQVLEEIRRQADRAEALVKAASQLNKQLEIGEVLDQFCVIANQALKARATAVFLLDAKRDLFTGMAAFTSDHDLKMQDGRNIVIPGNVLASVVGPENPVLVIPDMQAHPEWPYMELARKRNIHTLVIAGLFRRDQLIGALISVLKDQQKTILLEDVSLLRALTDQASGAIENAELFDQVRMGRERQRILAKSLVDIQEAERRHIATDLHDHLGQALTGLQFMLENVKREVSDSQKPQLNEIQKNVSDVMEQVREMSLNLRPSMLDDLGLIPTLEWHLTRYTSQTGIQVQFQHDEITKQMPAEIEITAYRIIQEALTNAARYAKVQEVFVGIACQEDTLWLEILDKGQGFDATAIVERPSTGLGGMRERAAMVGGFLVVESYISQGTQIVAALPLAGRPIERRKSDRKNHPG
jgi:PAS domain S-box-containing protein